MISYIFAHTKEEIEKAFALRYEVFVDEQKVPKDMEIDEDDASAIHVLAYDDVKVVGTGRMVIEGNIGRIGRIAVKKSARGMGVGKGVMEKLEEKAKVLSLTELYLHAQLYAKEFYTKLGYLERGNVFDEAGIDHIEMYKKLD